ncbi:hypothetical protein QE152_g4366 [Popillia japonica]|uniref:Uncharacterized protein n=1 Tax=Popillia japonica TaxID=7064 RepID=A0AAW1N159_POPJA
MSTPDRPRPKQQEPPALKLSSASWTTSSRVSAIQWQSLLKTALSLHPFPGTHHCADGTACIGPLQCILSPFPPSEPILWSAPPERRHQGIPAKALFRYEFRRPGEWRDPIPDEVQPQPHRTRAIYANEQRYCKRRYARPDTAMPIQPKVGDLVMVRDRPFAPRWIGPYPVFDTAGQISLSVEQPEPRRTKQHLNDVRVARLGNTALRLARDGPSGQPTPSPEPTPGPSWA